MTSGSGPARVRVRARLCWRCGLCLAGCPVGALRVIRGRIKAGSGCRGCAACLEICPAGAVELRPGPRVRAEKKEASRGF